MIRPLFSVLGAVALLLGWLGVVAYEVNGDPPAFVRALADSAERSHLPGLAARGYLLSADLERAKLERGGLDRKSKAGQAAIRHIIAMRMAAARLLLLNGYVPAAERIALEGARADFDDLQARALLLEIRLRGDQADSARRELMLLLLKHQDSQLLCLLGQSFARRGQKEDAAACYARSLNLDADHVPTLVALAQLEGAATATGRQALEKAAAAADTADERQLVAAAQARLDSSANPALQAVRSWWAGHYVTVFVVLAYLVFLFWPFFWALVHRAR